jgi:hypothetical protein
MRAAAERTEARQQQHTRKQQHTAAAHALASHRPRTTLPEVQVRADRCRWPALTHTLTLLALIMYRGELKRSVRSSCEAWAPTRPVRTRKINHCEARKG